MTRFGMMVVMFLAGATVGLIAYAVLLIPDTFWEEVFAAGLIGSVSGLVVRDGRLALLGSLACVVGWLAGTLLFGLALMLGPGAWILAGGALGTAAGVYRRSLPRAILGTLLGALAGLLSEAARFLTIFAEALRYADMQLLMLVSAGILLPLATSLVVGLRVGECTGS